MHDDLFVFLDILAKTNPFWWSVPMLCHHLKFSLETHTYTSISKRGLKTEPESLSENSLHTLVKKS